MENKADLIKRAWRFAYLAYSNPTRVIKQFPGKAILIESTSRGKGDTCFVISENGVTTVAFCGSNDGVDWFLNMPFFANYRGRHEGIALGVRRIADDIVAAINEFGDNKILVTGHSRGGGAAVEFVYRKGYQLHVQPDLVTFASPRTVKRKHIKKNRPLNVGIGLRVVNGRDVVPRMPPSAFGWRHRLERVEIGRKLTKREIVLRLYRAARARFKGYLPVVIGDHMPEAYDRIISSEFFRVDRG